jgi:uncharacterized protein
MKAWCFSKPSHPLNDLKRMLPLLAAFVLPALFLGIPGRIWAAAPPQAKTTVAVPAKLNRADNTTFAFKGYIQDYLTAVSANWLKVAYQRNPAILQMFADRDKQPYRNLLPWSGEFAGKYLCGATEVLRLTQDKELKRQLQEFVGRLISFQTEDGYLGPYPKPYQLTGTHPRTNDCNNCEDWEKHTWDTWNHYHIMLGLLLWYEQTHDPKALAAAQRIGDLLCRTFLGSPGKLTAIGYSEMNLAPVHSLCLLYHYIPQQRYLDLARQIINDEFPLTGDYFRTALAGTEYWQIPKPRWESMHSIQSIAEMYWLTGNEDYRRAYEHIWWSITKTDVHNTGGFSSCEKAVGNPYAVGSIETCCVVAFNAVSVDMLRLSGNSVVADQLEISLLNAVLGFQSRDGKWSTYHTPMDGVRKPNTIDIAFQKRPGSEEFNCCSANAPRGIGMLSEWALMKDTQGLILNWYGPCEITSEVNGVSVILKQQTDYPRTGVIDLTISPEKPAEFALKLRIPYWSQKTRVTINGRSEPTAPGTYLSLKRTWHKGDRVMIDLDMSPHFWAGENDLEDSRTSRQLVGPDPFNSGATDLRGRASIYHGPILLAFSYSDPADKDQQFDAANWQERMIDDPEAIVCLECTDVNGRKVRLYDFDSAGENGKNYVSWLRVLNVRKAPFSVSNPLRSGRVKE